MVNLLCVNLVVDCIICLNPKISKNSKYFLVSDQILFIPFILFVFFSVNIVQFLDMPTFKSCIIYHSSFNIFSAFKLSYMSKNLNWSGGFYVILAVISLVFGIRGSVKMLVLKQVLFLGN